MSDDDKEVEENRKLFLRTLEGLDRISLSMAESYDKALLTLSSAFLGGSLAFTNQVVDLINASAKSMLYAAWTAFAATIGLTLYSLYDGLRSIEPLRVAAKRFHIEKDEGAREVSVAAHYRALRFCRWQGIAFAAGIVLLGLFIAFNVWEGNVAQKPKLEERGIPPETFQTPAAPKLKPQQQGTGGTSGESQTEQPQRKPSAPAEGGSDAAKGSGK